MNHIYELNKGVRQMVLFTCKKKYGEQAVQRLESQGIPYVLQPAGQQNVNVYFGRREYNVKVDKALFTVAKLEKGL